MYPQWTGLPRRVLLVVFLGMSLLFAIVTIYPAVEMFKEGRPKALREMYQEPVITNVHTEDKLDSSASKNLQSDDEKLQIVVRKLLVDIMEDERQAMRAEREAERREDEGARVERARERNELSEEDGQVPRRNVSEVTLKPIMEEDVLIDRRVAEEVAKKVKVLCWIPTREMHRETRLKALNETWVKRCDKVIYIMTSPSRTYPDVVGVDIEDKRTTLTEKTVFAFTHLYTNFLDQFDWFLKADDDTYVVMENLKFLLSHFDPAVPGYIGCQFKHFGPRGYHSGGAGYAFNRLGLRQLVERGYRLPGRCRLAGGAEDIETGRCAAKAGVQTLNQLDWKNRETFLPGNVYAFVVGPPPDWAVQYMRTRMTAGLKCCSPLVVSFHYTGPKLMYVFEYLLYRVSVHGRQLLSDKAAGFFNGTVAKDFDRKDRRRPYPGEVLDEYYKEKWFKENATIYINPNQV